MRNAAGLVLLYGPLVAIGTAATSYKLLGLTGDQLIGTTFLVEGLALALGLRAIGLSMGAAVWIALASSAITLGLFFLWALAAHDGL